MCLHISVFLQKIQQNMKCEGNLESSRMDGARAQLVVVEQQVLEVTDGSESVSGDAADGVLLQMEQHQTARQTLGDDAQVVV